MQRGLIVIGFNLRLKYLVVYNFVLINLPIVHRLYSNDTEASDTKENLKL